MKKLSLLLILAVASLSTFALNKYEFILGLRTGAGAMLYDYTGTHRTLNGVDVGVYNERSICLTVPAMGEVLFGVRGFRFGYRFHYTWAMSKKLKTDIFVNTPTAQDFTSDADIQRNFFAHMFVLEYAIPANKTGTFAITPAIGIGGYRGFKQNMATREKTYYADILSTRVAVDVGLGFEFTKRRFSFVLAPTYTYYRIEPKTGDDDGSFHSFSLDFAFRLNLIKPRY